MNLGPRGLTLIQSFEDCRLEAYLDQRGIPTIGWGHTGPEVHLGLTWTQPQADQALVKDTEKAAEAVTCSLSRPVTQNQFDALASFTFNVGAGSEAHSTLLRDVNGGSLNAAADQFLVWDHVDGVPNAGLARRRAAERALFLTPDEA